MAAFVGEFQLPRLERVVSGPGAVDRLGEELDRYGVTRAVVVTGRTLSASSLLTDIARPLAGRCVAVFAGSRQHVPSCSVADLVRLVEKKRADGLVSVGGGSPIDTAKMAVHALLTAGERRSNRGEGLAHIAVPTTLSAGEFTSVAGITDEKMRIKRAVHDARIAPRTVITDPAMTLDTPSWLWAATGVRALDHAVETLYSARQHPLSAAAAEHGLSMLLAHLPRSLDADGAEQLEHRSHCQLAAWLSVFGMTNAGFGLSHALGHQIGPRWDVAHGFTSCITLPHVMRFMAERAPERFVPIARAFGLQVDEGRPRAAALACADRMAAFIGQFDVPRRLRDAGVPAAELDQVAGIVHGIMNEAEGGTAPVSQEAIAGVLAAAW
jgi:alcohol dehydrogenase class IV